MKPPGDRLAELLMVFRKGPGLTLDALAAEAGIARNIIARGYEFERGAETVAKIAAAASRLLHFEDATQLPRWLDGEDSPELEAFFADLLDLAECTKCHKWLPKAEIIKPFCRCERCVQEDGRAKMLQRRLAANPELAQYYESLYAALPTVREKDPELHDALAECRDGGEAITRPKIARKLGISPKQVYLRMLAVGLSALILWPLSSGSHFGESGTRRRRKGRAAAKAAAPVAPAPRGAGRKKGRVGRRPGEALAGEVGRRADHHRRRAARGRTAAARGELPLLAPSAPGGRP